MASWQHKPFRASDTLFSRRRYNGRSILVRVALTFLRILLAGILACAVGGILWFLAGGIPYLALIVTTLVFFGYLFQPWLQHRGVFEWNPFLLISVLIAFIVVVVGIDHIVHRQLTLNIVPVFPDATLRKVTYRPGDFFDNEPINTVHFSLPSAQRNFCDVTGYYDDELQKRGWYRPDLDIDMLSYVNTGECDDYRSYKHDTILGDPMIIVSRYDFETDGFNIPVHFRF